MTFRQFKYLSEDEQESLLWRKGVEIARTVDGTSQFVLFQVDGFYMEVEFTFPVKTVIQITCFEDVKFLDNYLESIDIQELLRA